MIAVTNNETAFEITTVLYRSEESIGRYLDCLCSQDFPHWRLTVVDNASPDAAADIVRARLDPRITLVSNATNREFAKAANQGLRSGLAAGGTCFLLMNNDTAFAPEFLSQFSEARQTVGAEVFSPRIMRMENTNEAWYTGGHFERTWLFRNRHEQAFDPSASRSPRPVEFASGCCLGITRSILDRVGLLDENFFVYWEDTDFCLRLEKAGIPVWYLPAVSILHEGGAASGGEWSPAYNQLYYTSYAQFVRKHFGVFSALLSIYRLVRLESGRPQCDLSAVWQMAQTMIPASLRSLKPETRIPPGL